MRKTGSMLAGFAVTASAFSPFAVAAPDETRGMALLAAYVYRTGALLRGAGAISATRNGAGDFSITFDRNVRDCFISATLVNEAGGYATGKIVASTNNSLPLQVRVVTMNASSTPSDLDFHVTVFCNR
jgi:hypothetical protein